MKNTYCIVINGVNCYENKEIVIKYPKFIRFFVFRKVNKDCNQILNINTASKNFCKKQKGNNDYSYY